MVDNTNTLLAVNPQLVIANGVHHDTQSKIRETSLSHYLRTSALDIFASAKNSSLFSTELERLSSTDELRSAFNPAPFNFLLALDLAPTLNRVLDLSQDLGGVSYFLSTKAEHVDCIQVDIGRARLASQRCQTLDNITFISEDLEALNFPQSRYDLIVLGDLNDLSLNATQLQTFFRKLQRSLSHIGCLIFTTENKGRLNRWLSKGHQVIPYRDLYLPHTDTSVTIPQLKQLLKSSEIKHANLFASFSLANNVSNMFAQDYLLNNPNAVNHFNRIGMVNNSDLNEYLLFKNLPKDSSYFDHASRYIAIVGNDLASINALCQNNFAHFPGTGRKAQWRTVTECKRGTNKVTKTHILNQQQRLELIQLSESGQHHKNQTRLIQDVSIKPFHQGPLLLDEWLTAALDCDVKRLGTLINEYATWLKSLERQEDFTDIAYDLLPFNIIVSANDQARAFQIIDSEWQLKTQYKADFVLFRALFWFAFENKAILKPFASTTKLTSIGLFICHFMDGIDQVRGLQPFVDLEESVQRQIGNHFRTKSVGFALNQRFNGDNAVVKSAQPACQISWGNNDLTFDEANSVYLDWNKSAQRQIITSEIPPARNLTTLRVDPIASTGLFNFFSIVLRNDLNEVIWQLNSSDNIISGSTLKNIETVTGSHQDTSFVALNDDPHFLFELNNVAKLDSATVIELKFSLIHDQNYDNTLSTLSHIVNEQNISLAEQANGINEKLAEIEVLQAELNHVSAHRAEIKSTLYETQQANAVHVQQMSQHIANLEHAQMRQPLSRLKRLMGRLMGR